MKRREFLKTTAAAALIPSVGLQELRASGYDTSQVFDDIPTVNSDIQIVSKYEYENMIKCKSTLYFVTE